MGTMTMQNAVAGNGSQARLSGEFFNKLTPEALKDLSAMATAISYPAGKIIFSEKDTASSIYIVLDGEVKLSMNSSDGRRLILRIARKGEILGLASALSGKASEITAETLYPAKLAPISRRDLTNFLMRHPEVYQTVTEELSARLHIGLRAAAHGRAVKFGTRKASPPAPRVEPERQDHRGWHALPLSTYARRDWRIHRRLA